MCPFPGDATSLGRREVVTALAPISDALLADGHDLSVISADLGSGDVALSLTALENACTDCLPERPDLIEIIEAAIRANIADLPALSISVVEK